MPILEIMEQLRFFFFVHVVSIFLSLYACSEAIDVFQHEWYRIRIKWKLCIPKLYSLSLQVILSSII